MKAYGGEGVYIHIHLDLGTSWRWVVSFTSRHALPPGNEPPVHIGWEVGWALEPVWTTWKREICYLYLDSNSDPSVVQWEGCGRCIAACFLVLGLVQGRAHRMWSSTLRLLLCSKTCLKRNFILNGNIFRSRDYHSIPWLNGNLASAEKCSGPLRFRLRQVLL
jgi:hypothetical protein